jgi:hypothetical protein
MSGGLVVGRNQFGQRLSRFGIGPEVSFLCTSSMTYRRRALDSPAAIFFTRALRADPGHVETMGQRDGKIRQPRHARYARPVAGRAGIWPRSASPDGAQTIPKTIPS